MVGLGLILAGRVTAQTFTVLHSFTGGDGTFPYAGLVLSGNTLYGTTALGGGSDGGTVFALKTDGTGFTTLYSFTGRGDGVALEAGLVLSGDTLYGTATGGGSSGVGTVFAINTDGTGFTTLHSFTGGSDGRSQPAGLILSDNFLYGTAQKGGSSGSGTVFKVNIDATGFTTLHSFLARDTNSGADSDGGEPFAGLILSGYTLYGTASDGGSSGIGTVFAVNTDGTGFTTLHSFAGPGDGANPEAGLILSGSTLYGTAPSGGSAGTVFAVNTDGTGFTNLHSFTAFSVCCVNSDGAGPSAG